VLRADSGQKGWDWAGRRLDIWGELGQQEQRSASATPSSASSMCSPQPDQVAFLQISQVTFEHIGGLLFVPLVYGVCPFSVDPTDQGLIVENDSPVIKLHLTVQKHDIDLISIIEPSVILFNVPVWPIKNNTFNSL
jgi:hypothetical protein